MIIIIIIKSNIILDSVLYHYDELRRGCYGAGHGNNLHMCKLHAIWWIYTPNTRK